MSGTILFKSGNEVVKERRKIGAKKVSGSAAHSTSPGYFLCHESHNSCLSSCHAA
jgi:hypothetical protein